MLAADIVQILAIYKTDRDVKTKLRFNWINTTIIC